MVKYKVEKFADNYSRFTVYHSEMNYRPTFYHFSDIHLDNPKCNRKAFFEHMQRCKDEKALCTIAGDLLCLMNGKYDPRRSKSGIRNEYNTDDYLDLVINDTANLLAPYAHQIMMISLGNHESSVSQKVGTNIIDRLIERINMIAGSKIVRGNYSGYIKIAIQQSLKSSKQKTYTMAYDHGHWGGVITKGTLSAVRYAAVLPQADIVHSGHTHTSWIVPQPVYYLDEKRKKVSIRNKWMIRSGTYKEEFAEGKGWATEKIYMPAFLGCVRTEVKNYGNWSEDGHLKFESTIIEA